MSDFHVAASETLLTERYLMKETEVTIPLKLWALGLDEGPGPDPEEEDCEIASLKKS